MVFEALRNGVVYPRGFEKQHRVASAIAMACLRRRGAIACLRAHLTSIMVLAMIWSCVCNR